MLVRSTALVLTLCVASLWLSASRAAAAVPSHAECATAGTAQATVLVLSPRADCRWFAAHGLRAVYATGDLGEQPFADLYRGARAIVTNYVHRDPDVPVFAFGWSRGGTVAEWLAEHGAVTGAVAYSAPADLVDWWQDQTAYWESIHMTEDDRRAASPLFHVGAHPAPLLLLHSPEDEIVPAWHSEKMHRRIPSSTLLLTSAPHGPPDYPVRRVAYDFFRELWSHRGAESPPPDPSFRGRNGGILFARYSLDGAGPGQIFTVRQNGTHLRKLTRGSGDKFAPAYSADGRRIAFSRSTTRRPWSVHIVVMDRRGRHRRQLTDAKADDSDAQFHPDGRTLVFSRLASTSGIYSIHADGSHARRLVRDAREPAFSPDGGSIAYTSFAEGKEGLFVMSSDGTHRRRLTRDPLSAPDPAGHRQFLHVDSGPDFSPDGRHIVFVRQPAGCAEGGDVYVMDVDGGDVQAVTHGESPCGAYSAPAYAPGGERIVVSRLSSLQVMRADGSHRRVLRAGRHQYYSPDWQPLPR